MAKRLSWAVRIRRAEKRGEFTDQEHDWALDSWLTCAVGEKHKWLIESNWSPRGDKEYDLGIAFGYAVKSDDVPEARRLYAEIMALPV